MKNKKQKQTIESDIKELHELIVKAQVNGNKNNNRIKELQNKIDHFYYGLR